MSFNLRLVLVALHAAFVLAMSVQASLDTPHRYAPPAVAAGEQVDLGEDGLAAAEDVTAGQHETEASADHAMIGPVAVTVPPPQGVQAYGGAHGPGLPAGHAAAALERPPRPLLAA